MFNIGNYIKQHSQYDETKGSIIPMAKKKSNIPTNETGEARFIRVALLKTNSVLKSLKSLSNLRGKRAVSTSAQRLAIQTAIDAAFKDCMSALNGATKETSGFKW